MLSVLAEPVGAGDDEAAAPPELMGILFGGVAGIVVYVSLDDRTSRLLQPQAVDRLGQTQAIGVETTKLIFHHPSQPMASAAKPKRNTGLQQQQST